MTNDTHMTIHDYFKRAGMGSDMGRHLRKRPASSSGDGDDFVRLLEGLQPPPQPSTTSSPIGMGISDYWKHPLAAKPTIRERSAPSNGAASTRNTFGQTVSTEPKPSIPETWVDASALTPSTPETQKNSQREMMPDELISDSIYAAADKYNVPAGLIRSVIRAESNFQPDAVSRAGAQGLMQLMPATAKELGVEDAFDIEQNIDGGARYLRQMLDMFNGNLKQALAAYNAGPGTVRRYNGNVPYQETRNYVSKVLAFSRQYAV